MKVIDPPLFAKSRIGTITYDEVAVLLGFEISKVEDVDEDINVSWWRYCTDPTYPDSKAALLDRAVRQYHFENRAAIVPFTALLIDALKIN